jgi:dCTP deaminase
MLSDRDIKAALAAGLITIDPLDPNDVQPASVDVHLADGLRDIRDDRMYWINTYASHDTVTHVEPGAFWLASIEETVLVDPAYAFFIEGKSSVARLGLSVHDAGFIDPGFHGQVTLELKNQGPLRIELRAGMPIAQLRIVRLSSPAERPYGSPGLNSHYQDQRGATPSWMTEAGR